MKSFLFCSLICSHPKMQQNLGRNFFGEIEETFCFLKLETRTFIPQNVRKIFGWIYIRKFFQSSYFLFFGLEAENCSRQSYNTLLQQKTLIFFFFLSFTVQLTFQGILFSNSVLSAVTPEERHFLGLGPLCKTIVYYIKLLEKIPIWYNTHCNYSLAHKNKCIKPEMLNGACKSYLRFQFQYHISK